MVALGLVLLILAALFTLGTVFINGQDAMAEVFGISLSGVSVGGLFLAGVVTGAVALLGLFLMLGGTVRRRHKKVEGKRARGASSDLEQENSRLHAELEQARRAPAPEPAPVRSPAPVGTAGVEPYPAPDLSKDRERR